jgi:hypothetical protein
MRGPYIAGRKYHVPSPCRALPDRVGAEVTKTRSCARVIRDICRLDPPEDSDKHDKHASRHLQAGTKTQFRWPAARLTAYEPGACSPFPRGKRSCARSSCPPNALQTRQTPVVHNIPELQLGRGASGSSGSSGSSSACVRNSRDLVGHPGAELGCFFHLPGRGEHLRGPPTNWVGGGGGPRTTRRCHRRRRADLSRWPKEGPRFIFCR